MQLPPPCLHSHSPSHSQANLELDEICENESLVSLHEFKFNGSGSRQQRSGSETTWNYKKQFLLARERIPYIDEVSHSIVGSFSSKEKNASSSSFKKINSCVPTNRLSKLSADFVSVSNILSFFFT